MVMVREGERREKSRSYDVDVVIFVHLDSIKEKKK
jgi:hypothetical protein